MRMETVRATTRTPSSFPGYVCVDTMFGYRTVLARVPVEAQLNVKNINDTRYFEATGGGIYSYYGAPRTFVGSLKVKF